MSTKYKNQQTEFNHQQMKTKTESQGLTTDSYIFR